MVELRKFMFKNIYLGNILKEERNKAKFILEQLIKHYSENPQSYARIL